MAVQVNSKKAENNPSCDREAIAMAGEIARERAISQEYAQTLTNFRGFAVKG